MYNAGLKKFSCSQTEVLKLESFVDSSYLCLFPETIVDFDANFLVVTQFSSRSYSIVALLVASRHIVLSNIRFASVEIVFPGFG